MPLMPALRRGAVLLGLCAASLHAADAPLPTERIATRVHMVVSAGAGNVTVFVTEDGLLVVDSGVPDSAVQVAAAIRAISPLPVRYLVNTHYHGDHAGGNATVGQGATILAHASSRRTALANLKPGEGAAAAGVPQETYETEKALTLGGQPVRLLHLGAAHTSGDTVVVFPGEKVLVAGDLFFNGVRPYIDVADGSDTGNWVATIKTLAERYPDCKVIPGHGPVTDMAAYLRFAQYLSTLRDKVAKAVAAGKSREETVASVTLDEFPGIRDFVDYGLTTGANVGWVYDELTRTPRR